MIVSAFVKLPDINVGDPIPVLSPHSEPVRVERIDPLGAHLSEPLPEGQVMLYTEKEQEDIQTSEKVFIGTSVVNHPVLDEEGNPKRDEEGHPLVATEEVPLYTDVLSYTTVEKRTTYAVALLEETQEIRPEA